MIDLLIKQAPTIATLFFFIFFCYIVFSVFKKGAKKKFNEYAQIPLKEEFDEEEVVKKKVKKSIKK